MGTPGSAYAALVSDLAGPGLRPAAGSPGPIVVAHLSDLHLGAHFPGVVDSLVADVVAARPMLTVITGDLTMRARPPEFAEAFSLLSRLPEPRLVVLGNHDVPLAPASRLRTPYAGYEARFGGDLDPVREIGGLRALGLNSMPRWRWKEGRASLRQARMVTEVLGPEPALAPASPVPAGSSLPLVPPVPFVRLLAMHHPLSMPTSGGILGRQRLLRSLADARVDLVLTGHTHVPAVHRLALPGPGDRSVVEVTAGTATSHRLRGTPLSWTLLHIGAETVDVHERHHTGTGWHEGRTVHEPRPRLTRG